MGDMEAISSIAKGACQMGFITCINNHCVVFMVVFDGSFSNRHPSGAIFFCAHQ